MELDFVKEIYNNYPPGDIHVQADMSQMIHLLTDDVKTLVEFIKNKGLEVPFLNVYYEGR